MKTQFAILLTAAGLFYPAQGWSASEHWVATCATALTIGAAHVALRAKESEIDPATDRALTFAGKLSCTIQPGVLLFSDPVELRVAPLSDLAVSMYLPKDTGSPTSHVVGLHTAY